MLKDCKLEVPEIVRVQNAAKEKQAELNEKLENPVKIDGNTYVNATDEYKEELEQVEKELQPVWLERVKIPGTLLFVRFKSISARYEYSRDGLEDGFIVLGEVAQKPGYVVIQNPITNRILVGVEADRLEVIPPHELDLWAINNKISSID